MSDTENVVKLPLQQVHQPYTPRELLEKMLECVDDLEHVTVCFKHKETKRTDVRFSAMRIEQLFFHAGIMQMHAQAAAEAVGDGVLDPDEEG